MKQLVVYRCQHCGGSNRIFKETWLHERVMSCSAQLEEVHILKALANSAKGVCVVLCPKKKCKTIEGSLIAEKKIRHAQNLLSEAGIESLRIKQIFFETIDTYKNAVIEFNSFLENMR